MTVVVGTAGHIDHGKTTLLRALTGMDADRLPEEQRRGMTIDVGYAHLDLEDGTSIDFVDVPGHDALIGNMLVGAGEIDAAMLIVAADDGPRAQTLEHLALLDALGIRHGLAVVTKADLGGEERTAEVVAALRELLARTSLAGVPVLAVSSVTGAGLPDVRAALVRLRDRAVAAVPSGGPLRLALDRVFEIRGRGTVVTGSLRGGALRSGYALRVEPGGLSVRVRGLQVHHGSVDTAMGGRTAANLAGAGVEALTRGSVLTAGPGIETSDRLLVALTRPAHLADAASRGSGTAWPPTDGTGVRLHIGTMAVEAMVGRRGREATELGEGKVTAILRLGEPVATFVGDGGVLRRPSPGEVLAGVTILDTAPARGISRRRATPERLAALAVAVAERDVDAAADALTGLHGAIGVVRIDAVAGALGSAGHLVATGADGGRGLVLAPDVRDALEAVALQLVATHHRDHPLDVGIPLGTLRPAVHTAMRRLVTVPREAAAAADEAIAGLIAVLETRKRLARDGDRLSDPARGAGPTPALAAAMDRLEALLDVAAPPDLAAAARAAACPPDGIRALEAAGRIVRVEADLAWAAPAFHRLAAQALALARREPLTPAALRDATGTSRRYVMPLIEDLGRRGVLVRTPAGHVPGPRAPRPTGAAE